MPESSWWLAPFVESTFFRTSKAWREGEVSRRHAVAGGRVEFFVLNAHPEAFGFRPLPGKDSIPNNGHSDGSRVALFLKGNFPTAGQVVSSQLEGQAAVCVSALGP